MIGISNEEIEQKFEGLTVSAAVTAAAATDTIRFTVLPS